MNRLPSLQRALRTWLELTEVDKIIIVDWNSDVPLNETLRSVKDPRLHIIKVLGERHWCNSKCHNLEFRLAGNNDLLFRVDSDVLVRKDFFSKHHYDPQGFHSINWRTVIPQVDDKRHLAGTLLIETKHLWTINGYNERLIHYGKEDDDIHNRLLAAGLKWNEIDLDTLDHIPHNDIQRYEHLQIAPLVDRLIELKYGPNETSALTRLSNNIMIEQPWTPRDRMTDWIISWETEHYGTCWDARNQSQRQ